MSASSSVWMMRFRSASASPRYLNGDRKSTRLNSSHGYISYAVFCLKKKKRNAFHVIADAQIVRQDRLEASLQSLLDYPHAGILDRLDVHVVCRVAHL